MNTELNAFLALVEGRPETFRQMLRGVPRSDVPPATIQERIQRAAENLKCKAVKEAIREIYKATLRLQPNPTVFADAGQRDAFYLGVEAVEEVLSRALATCEEAEKQLGPQSEPART